MKKRDPIVSIILSIVTCGIYGIYWFICINNDSNTLAEDHDSPSGGIAFLLSLITCGIYLFIWNYKMGKKVYAIQLKNNVDATDNSILFLILSLCGLSIVNYFLIQTELNKFIIEEGV